MRFASVVPGLVPAACLLLLSVTLLGAGGTVSPSAPELRPPPTAREKAALQAFLQKSLSPGSPLRAKDPLTRAQLRRDDRLARSRPLEFFPPYRLIKVTYWNPAAGAPGQVMDDLRILWDRKRGRFKVGSRAFLSAHRKAHPLKVVDFEVARMKRYVEEIFLILPWVDRWGPRIKKLEVSRPVRVRLTLKEISRMDDFTPDGRQDLIQFRPNGDVRSSRFLDQERGPDP